MINFIFANNVNTALAASAASNATKSVFEVCYVTAISGNTLTVLRGQEGTTAQSWLAGW
ncbi:hypothetical protein [Acinetobacter sp. ANC 4633]|uniref:hypothetical protein n=1 Tax=Acinetobacter sp. ANC 4633 TaxID=2529845 RepID=UPI0013F14B5D|nr:hypothetical protein [Acinetobacter sp. ANC 4633]